MVGLAATQAIASAASGKLNDAQIKAVKAVGISIAVPSYVPTGFAVHKLTTEPCPADAPRNTAGVCLARSSYQILYRDPANVCFAVYGTYTRGIGGGGSGFSFDVKTKLLGETGISFGTSKNYEDKVPSPQQLRSPQQNIWSFPVYQKGTSNIYGIRTIENQSGCGSNRRLTPLEMEKILQSLTWLR